VLPIKEGNRKKASIENPFIKPLSAYAELINVGDEVVEVTLSNTPAPDAIASVEISNNEPK
jgi:hypothetical protein